MKKISFSILFMVTFSLFAQNNNNKWTLEECIRYATEHNIEIKQKKLIKENSEIDLNTARMSRLPDLNVTAGQEWDFGRSNKTSSGIYENQTASTTNLSISSSTTLFSGFRISNNIERCKLDLEASGQNLEKAKEDLALNIASVFLQVLLNKELLKVDEDQLSLSQFQVDRTEQLVEAGKVSASQLYDIKAQEAKDEVNVTQARNNLRLSLLDLAQKLELEHSVSFDIETPELGDIFVENIQSTLTPENIYNNAVGFKPQIKELELRQESTKSSLKIAQSGYIPTLSLDLGYDNEYFYNNSIQNKSFANQFKNNEGEYVVLNLSIPIFNRFAIRNQVRTAKLNIESQHLLLENEKKTLYKEIQTAYVNAISAQEKYRSTQKSVAASQESFRYAVERYQAGKASVFEFNEAKNQLGQSLSEQIQSKYDYIFTSKILDFYNGLPIKL